MSRTDRLQDPKVFLEILRDLTAPVFQLQQASLQAADGFARHQFAVAGDCLEWSLSQSRAALAAAKSPEFFARQLQLIAVLGEQLRKRIQALTNVRPVVAVPVQAEKPAALVAKEVEAIPTIDSARFAPTIPLSSPSAPEAAEQHQADGPTAPRLNVAVPILSAPAATSRVGNPSVKSLATVAKIDASRPSAQSPRVQAAFSVNSTIAPKSPLAGQSRTMPVRGGAKRRK